MKRLTEAYTWDGIEEADYREQLADLTCRRAPKAAGRPIDSARPEGYRGQPNSSLRTVPNRPVLTMLAGLCGSVIFGVLVGSAFEAVTRALAGEVMSPRKLARPAALES
jgi:hypothetical protein